MAVAGALGMHLYARWAVFGALSFFVVDASVRSAYSRWLRSGRMNGRFSRSVVLVGDNDEALELYELTQSHPEAGLVVTGIVGGPGATVSPIAGVPLLGTIDDLPNAVDSVNGVIVASSSFPAPTSTGRCGRCSAPTSTCSCRAA